MVGSIVAKEMSSFKEDDSFTFKMAHQFLNAGGGKDAFQEGESIKWFVISSYLQKGSHVIEYSGMAFTPPL